MNSMKNAEELYMYCKKNMYTSNWIASIKRDAQTCLRDEVPRCNGSYYSSRRIEYDYITELWLILENKCCEQTYKEEVHVVVNMLFQDIADELTSELPLQNSYKIVLCARNSDETALWLGPSYYAKNFLKIFLQSGYAAALARL